MEPGHVGADDGQFLKSFLVRTLFLLSIANFTATVSSAPLLVN
jgi:hypothetical protein